jgi:hypothetical protein
VADLQRHQRLTKLGEEHGTSAGRVRTILLERGVMLRSRGGAVRKPDPERATRARALAKQYAAGATLQDLAAEHGVGPTTARNLVLAGGGTLRGRSITATTAKN